jgi:hypothetical protein
MKKNLFRPDLVEHKSHPPLRWIANFSGSISGWAILKISNYDELENFGWRYKFHSLIWKITWPFYYRFGTFYLFDFDIEGDGWNDYDSDGVPYWEKGVDWDYEDEETGDAFRVIRSKNGNM